MPGLDKLKTGNEMVVRSNRGAAGQTSVRLWVDGSGVVHVRSVSAEGPEAADAVSINGRHPAFSYRLYTPAPWDRFAHATPADVWARGDWAGMTYASWAPPPYVIKAVNEPVRSTPDSLKDLRLRTGAWIQA